MKKKWKERNEILPSSIFLPFFDLRVSHGNLQSVREKSRVQEEKVGEDFHSIYRLAGENKKLKLLNLKLSPEKAKRRHDSQQCSTRLNILLGLHSGKKVFFSFKLKEFTRSSRFPSTHKKFDFINELRHFVCLVERVFIFVKLSFSLNEKSPHSSTMVWC